MKKLIYVSIFALLLSVASEAFAQTAAAPQKVMTEMVVISPQAGTMTMVSYMSGKDFRMETYKGQGDKKNLQSLMIAKDGFMYMLNPAQKSGMKMSMNSPMAGQKDSGKPQETSWEKITEEFKAKGYVVTNRGKEKWEGREYEVWRVSMSNQGYTDYYIDNTKMAKRFVSYDAKGQMISDSRIVKIETGKPLPDGALDIPADYKIMDMSQMKIPGMGGGKP